jgi:hypothetical protein
MAQHPASDRSVDVELVAVTPVASGDDERLPVHYESQVADQSLIEDSVERLVVIAAALRQPADRRTLRWGHIG